MKKFWKKIQILFFGVFPLVIAACSSTQPLNYNDLKMPILSWVENNLNSKENSSKLAIPNFSQSTSKISDFFLKRLISLNILKKEISPLAINPSVVLESGTGWILAKASTDLNDWNYYVGTNIHVADGFVSNAFNQVISYQFALNPLINNLVTNTYPSKNVLLNKDQNQQTLISGNVQSTDGTIDFTKSDYFPFSRGTELGSQNTNVNDSDPFSNSDLSKLLFPPSLLQSQLSTDKIFYEAKNLSVNNVEYYPNQSETTKNSNFKHTLNGVSNSYESQKYAADFAVMKVNFKPAYDLLVEKKIANPLKLERLKIFFDYLKNLGDVEFAPTDTTTNQPGYLGGYPALWNQNDKNTKQEFQFVTLKINSPQTMTVPIGDPTITTLKIGGGILGSQTYWTPTVNFSVQKLNLGPGSSGSVYLNQKGQILGIYWGIFLDSSTTKPASDNDSKINFNDLSFGQITKFRVKDKYDLIGGSKLDNTPNEHSLCNVILNQKSSDNQTRIPSFCS